MPPKKNNVKGGVKPKYKRSSCEICIEMDTDEMVACDECNKWFHYQCAGVTGDIKNESWSCQLCRKPPVQSLTEKSSKSREKNSSKKSSSNEPHPPKAFSFQSSRQTSMTYRQKALALKKLEEEERIKLDILERKFQIMECSDAEDTSGDDFVKDQGFQNNSFEYTLQWVKNVHQITENLMRDIRSDKISVSASDKDRELINKFYPSNVQSTLLDQEVKHQAKIHKENRELAFIVQEFKKFREGKNADQLSQTQPSECQSRKVRFDQPDLNSANVAQQQMCFGQKFIARPESDPHKHPFELPNYNQETMQVGYGSSAVQQPLTIRDSTNVQYGRNPSTNVGFGQTNDFNNQLSQPNFGFDTLGISNKYQPSTNHEFGSANVPFNQQQQKNIGFDLPNPPNFNNQQQHKNIGFDLPNAPNFNNQQQKGNIQYRPVHFGTSNNYQQQSPNYASSSNLKASGYVGHVGPLTQNHIAARHTHSKDLPIFRGHPEEWPMFLSALINSTEACGFSDGDNLGRLQRCLKDDALDAVRSRLIHAISVPGVVETLHLLFGRPNLIIHTLLEKINKTPSPKADDLNSLIKFAIAVQNLCGTIESSKNLEYLRNPTLMQSLTDKLPTQIQLNWAYFKHSAGNVDLSVFGNWLYHLAQVAVEVVNPSLVKISEKKYQRDNEDHRDSDSDSEVRSDSDSNTKETCKACDSDTNHNLENCKQFRKLSVDDRWKLIKKYGICGTCFDHHRYYKCSRKLECGVDGCKFMHHALLHNSPSVLESKVNSSSSHNQNDVKKPLNGGKDVVEKC